MFGFGSVDYQKYFLIFSLCVWISVLWVNYWVGLFQFDVELCCLDSFKVFEPKKLCTFQLKCHILIYIFFQLCQEPSYRFFWVSQVFLLNIVDFLLVCLIIFESLRWIHICYCICLEQINNMLFLRVLQH